MHWVCLILQTSCEHCARCLTLRIRKNTSESDGQTTLPLQCVVQGCQMRTCCSLSSCSDSCLLCDVPVLVVQCKCRGVSYSSYSKQRRGVCVGRCALNPFRSQQPKADSGFPFVAWCDEYNGFDVSQTAETLGRRLVFDYRNSIVRCGLLHECRPSTCHKGFLGKLGFCRLGFWHWWKVPGEEKHGCDAMVASSFPKLV